MKFSTHRPKVERYSECDLPTLYGTFRVVAFREAGNPNEHLAIIHGDVEDEADVLARVHSECLTGEVLGSLKCECREQLQLALERIAKAPRGVVFYLRQEGRGIGLGNKIRAYQKQDEGYDTVDANRVLGFPDDMRRYHMVRAMADSIGVRSVTLMTNNPAKVEGLRSEGIIVSARLDHFIEPHEVNRGYLETKAERMGHLLDLETSDLETSEADLYDAE